MSARAIVAFLLGAVVVYSALAVVYAKHQSRKRFVELQVLQAARDEMNIEWGRLQLEQSTWAAHGRVERVARRELGMFTPATDAVAVIKP